MRELTCNLAAQGYPRKQVQRVAQETSDHWDDLEAEAIEHGAGIVDAARIVCERMGEPAALVRAHRERMRQAHWSGRHPILTFGVVPPFLLALWFLAWTAMAMGAGEVYGKLLSLPTPVWSSYLVVLLWTTVIHYTGVVAVPAFLSWWARRTFCDGHWGWIACAACALHGLLNQVTVRPHKLQWGYGFAPPDWIPVFAPLLVGVVAHFWSRRRRWQGVVVVLAAALGTGCASSKVPQQRGWIGGEYKEAATATSGILVTRLSTNAPAARGGLQEGDLVLAVDGTPVKNLRAFWKNVDAASPGQHLCVKVFRHGREMERNVVVGKEVFKPSHSLTAGILLSREWDIWPNPGFSLVALGYKQQDRRIDLDSPEARFKMVRRDSESPRGLRSREGWEVWLPVCSFSSRKRILEQTADESPAL